jgi:Domain of unknown function (DUF5666)
MTRADSEIYRGLKRWTRVAQAALLFGSVCTFAAAQGTQQHHDATIKGYITRFESVTQFDVNATHISTNAQTSFGVAGKTTPTSSSALGLGVRVQVSGDLDKKTHTILASSVHLPEEQSRKLSGIGIIDKLFSTGSEPVFRADGYRIRITPLTDVSYTRDLKSLAGIAANDWIRYEGTRDSDGTLVADKVTFLPIKSGHFKNMTGPEIDDARLVSAPVTEKKKTRFSDEAYRFREVDDPAVQDRIRRIGQGVIPAYQKALAANDPFRIQFRFAAVEDQKYENYRSEICSKDGLILVPRVVFERLQSDDQLAAVLADGVALNLQMQTARLSASDWALLSAYAATDAASLFVPGLSFAPAVADAIHQHQRFISMEEQRGRIALTLLSDAGYDMRAAPEAWRLLAPKHLPADTSALEYPDRSGYQLSILNLQYRVKPATPPPNTVAETR